MADRTCSFPDCGLPVRRNGLCNGHSQQLRGGRPLAPLKRRNAGRLCSFSGCDRPSRKTGLCDAHYNQARSGSALTPIRKRVNVTFLTYPAAHKRLTALRGAAKTHTCICGKPAQAWAFQHSCDAALFFDGMPYCEHPEHYAPMCKPCHRLFDDGHC
jgi:hypothetical protein